MQCRVAPRGGGHKLGQINIRKTELRDGTISYTVYIVGTQEVYAGTANPFDSESAVAAGLQGRTDVTLAVLEAMRLAGIGPDDPVMLVGHSLGALTAADLAADHEFRNSYNVQSVVAAGATISGRDIPPPISVLEIANPYDPVVEASKIGGGANRMEGRPNFFRKEVGGVPGGFGLAFSALLNPFLSPVAKLALAATMLKFHDLDVYEVMIRGWEGGDNSGEAWQKLNANFLCGENVKSSSMIEFDVHLAV